MYLDVIRAGDREQVLAIQKLAECDFLIPDPLTGFVVRNDETGAVVGWAGWEPVAEVLGIIRPELPLKEKIRIWSSLHKPVESELVRRGLTVAYIHIKKEHSKFAALLNWLGWKFVPGFWMRREAGQTLNQERETIATDHKSFV